MMDHCSQQMWEVGEAATLMAVIKSVMGCEVKMREV
jgi:hypothetical protein